MGLHVHRADRTDLLADGLAGLLAVPPGDPFAADVVAVPAKGVERWLSQRLSHRLGAQPGRGDGVCAAVEFRTPWALVAEIAGTGDDDPWAPAVLTWPVLAALDAGLGEQWAAPLAAHLGDPDDELRRGRRLALARRLARLFASYAAQRPTVLVAWEGGHDSDGLGEPVPADLAWQPHLWRAVVNRVAAPTPATRHTEVLAALRDRPDTLALPARLSLFGHTRLSATDVELLAGLGAHRDVHLWLPHPSPALWQALAEAGCDRPVRRRTDTSHLVVGHPLLAGLGRDVRELQRTLGPLGASGDVLAPGAHRSPGGLPDRLPALGRSTLLGWLHADLHADARPDEATRRARLLDPADRSVQVHACHGPARQVEVLREVLLGLLADDPSLQPRDIVVMCPDIEAYAPLIMAGFGLGEAVGRHGHPGHRLRVHLADRAAQQTNPLLGVLAALLDLAGGRAQASAVLDLAHTPPVRRRFGFTDDDLERITTWVTQVGVRWGFDAAHRRDVGLGEFVHNTWRLGLDRVLAGVAMSDDTGVWLGTVLPLDDVASSQVELAGRLAEFVDRLREVTDGLVGCHPLGHWLRVLGDGLSALTDVGAAEHWQLGQAHRELARIADEAGPDAGLTDGLRLPDLRALLADRLGGRPTRAGFRTGTLTVCTMVPMRSVPHRVVVLLGLDDGVFPRVGGLDGDDLLARGPVTGERDVRSEDRQLLLDAILAAQEHLVITYTGADPHSGARRPPAVPLGELLDALDATATAPTTSAAGTAAGSAAGDAAYRPERVRDLVTVTHPVQRFDPRNHEVGALVPGTAFGFDDAALRGAQTAAEPRHEPRPFLDGPLPAAPLPDVRLDDLVGFVKAPVRHLLGPARLDIALPRDAERVSDEIPLSVDALQQWAIGDRLLTDLLAGHDLDAAMQREWRRGTLPPGRLGWSMLRAVADGVHAPAQEAGQWRTAAAQSVDIDVDLGGGRRLQGTVAHVYADRLVPVSYAKLGPGHRLTTWVQLLALAGTHPEVPWTARTIGRGGRDSTVSWADLGPLDPTMVAAALADLVLLRDLGLREPLPLPLKAGAAYAAARHRGSPAAGALARARETWSGKFPEREDAGRAAYELVWGPRPQLPGQQPAEPALALPDEPTRFGAAAMRLWGPLLAAERRGGR